MSLEERQKIYVEHRVEYPLLGGVMFVGGEMIFPEFHNLTLYFKDCGCPQAAELMSKEWKSRPIEWALEGLALASWAPLANASNQQNDQVALGILGASFFSGAVI